MRALVHRPGGSPALRHRIAVWLVSACAMIAVLLAGGLYGGTTPALVTMVVTGMLAVFAAPFLERRRTPIDAELEFLPGTLLVRSQTGKVVATIKARSLLGASAARLPGSHSPSSAAPSGEGVSLVLAQKPRGSRPTVLRLADEAQADEVRRCLGVGPGGFGLAQWPSGPERDAILRGVFRLGWRGALLYTMLDALLGHEPTGLAFLTLFAGSLALAMRLSARAPWIRLSGRGVSGHVCDEHGAYGDAEIPFPAIRTIHDSPTGNTLTLECAPPQGTLVFNLRPARGLRGLDVEEREHVVAQLQAAVARARQPSFHAEKASRLSLLRRRPETEPPDAWVARLDALGRALRGARDYRTLALDEAELWSAVEDPDVEEDLRGAAARVLLRADEPKARKRIEATLSAERSPAAAKRIRVVLEEAEVAAQAAESAEAAERSLTHR